MFIQLRNSFIIEEFPAKRFPLKTGSGSIDMRR